jgi:hypothetical protein
MKSLKNTYRLRTLIVMLFKDDQLTLLRPPAFWLCMSLAILVSFLGALVSPQVEAQEPTEKPKFQSLLTEMEETLRGIEVHVSRIESTGLIDQRSLEVEELFAQFGEAARAAFQMASEEVMKETEPEVVIEADQTGRDDPKEDTERRKPLESVALMEELENLLLGHRRRVEGIIPRIAEIDAEVSRGEVRISDEILRDLTPEELKEFGSTLTPKARRLYRKWLPDQHSEVPSLLERFANVLVPHLFPDPIGALSKNVAQRRAYCYDQMAKIARYQHSEVPSLLERFANVLVPPAHAGLAVGCLAICKKSLGAACFACVAAAAPIARNRLEEYEECRSGCGRCRWFRPIACACHGLCVIELLAWIG